MQILRFASRLCTFANLKMRLKLISENFKGSKTEAGRYQPFFGAKFCTILKIMRFLVANSMMF
jgi:hypothetical protein